MTTAVPEIRSGGTWTSVRLGDVCEINPRRPAMNRSDDTVTTFVPMSAVDGEHGVIAAAEAKLYVVVKKGYTYFGEGDVLFAKITPCMQNGKHAIAKGLIDGIGFGTTEFHVIRPGERITSEWIHYFLRQPRLLEAATAHFSGAVGQQRLPEDYLRNLEIPLPPVVEQKRIAAILNEQMTAVEKARAVSDVQIDAARRLRSAYLRAIFSSSTSRSWKRCLLRDVSDRITDGTHLPPPFTSEGIPFLFVRNIVSGRIDFNVEKFVSTQTYEDLVKRCRPVRGDVLYSAVGSFGVAVVIDTDRPFTFQRHIAHIKLRRAEVMPEFLAAYINSPEGQAQSEAAALGGAQRTVTLSSLGRFEVLVPPIETQRSLVATLRDQLSSAERVQTDAESTGNLLNNMPGALLRRAFSGQI
jgi:type I restriction enzyme S subunit